MTKEDDFACIVLPATTYVRGLDGMLYCDECFGVLWPEETPVVVATTP